MIDEIEQQYQNVTSSIEAEQSLIGGLLLDPTPIHEVIDLLTEQDFYVRFNRLAWSAIASIVSDGGQVDAFLVADKLSSVTGESCLPRIIELMDSSSGSSNAIAYARVILEKSLKRKTLEASNAISRFIIDTPTATIAQVTEFAQSTIFGLETHDEKGISASTMNEALKRAVEDVGRRFDHGAGLEGHSTGMQRIDELTNGYKRGELIVLAARPSMGKSTIAVQQAGFMGLNSGLRGLFFSLEVPERELTKKLIACTGHIDLNTIKNPRGCNESFWPALESSVSRLKNSRLQLIDCPGIHINQIRSYSRKAARREKLDFIFVDHIHLVRADGQSREREVAAISGGLKTLAIELDIPVIALAQLSRKIEERSITDRRPQMSDLRDSGAVEQDADIIQFVYRDDYYNPNGMNNGLIEVLQRKNRNGELGEAYFQNVYSQSRVEPTNRFPVFEEKKKSSRGRDL
jgi:replicative DNA helicase